jgi:hypothetical protein
MKLKFKCPKCGGDELELHQRGTLYTSMYKEIFYDEGNIFCEYDENQKYQGILIQPNEPWTFVSKQTPLYSSVRLHTVLWSSAVIHGLLPDFTNYFANDSILSDKDIDAVLE